MLTITENVKFYRNCNEELEWMAKSVAARKLIRMKVARTSYLQTQVRKKSKQQRKYDKFLRRMRKCHRHKKGIVITARVHPGEAQASWICQGLIQFLVSDHPDAILIRKQFVIKVIPMLNPDGVIYGNYRCSLLGFDLNRRWMQPSRLYDPTIFYTKKMLSVFKEERDIQLF